MVALPIVSPPELRGRAEHDGPSPQQMYQRFLGWSPFRRPIVEPPA
ncbi:hypothetical protein [Micromonospora sp. RP3T]|nr:hypothetical protein [Micromonospora sp. RP3T]